MELNLGKILASSFPAPPIPGDDLLIPLASMKAIAADAAEMGFSFSAEFTDHVLEEVAYFFSWRGYPRSTVLVIYTDAGLAHVEARRQGGSFVGDEDLEPMLNILRHQFRKRDLLGSHLPR